MHIIFLENEEEKELNFNKCNYNKCLLYIQF